MPGNRSSRQDVLHRTLTFGALEQALRNACTRRRRTPWQPASLDRPRPYRRRLWPRNGFTPRSPCAAALVIFSVMGRQWGWAGFDCNPVIYTACRAHDNSSTRPRLRGALCPDARLLVTHIPCCGLGGDTVGPAFRLYHVRNCMCRYFGCGNCRGEGVLYATHPFTIRLSFGGRIEELGFSFSIFRDEFIVRSRFQKVNLVCNSSLRLSADSENPFLPDLRPRKADSLA